MSVPRPRRILSRRPCDQQRADAGPWGASSPCDPEEYVQLLEAMTDHLHQVADFVEVERHDKALVSFRAAMAISSELEIQSVPANGSRRR